MSTGGKVNSTCCRVHKNVELVPDSAGMRMYVRTTRQVRVDSEILVMYQGANKLALIMFTSVTCMLTSITCMFTS